MLEKFFDLGNHVLKYTGHLDRTTWTMVFIGVVAVGFFCMKGFGSRNDY